MAKKFLASEYEINRLIGGDLGYACKVHKDWYRQRFVMETDELLKERVRIDFPLALPRDQFDSSIIPGSITGVEDVKTIDLLKECLGVNSGSECLFSVMTGRLYRAYRDVPARFTLLNPQLSRDVILMASWPKNTPLPSNLSQTFIYDSFVAKSAFFEDDGYDHCAAVWIIPTRSPLGERLSTEAYEHYTERVTAGIRHFENYADDCAKIRDNLWTRLYAESQETTDRHPTARLTLCDFYIHAEWHDADGEACDDYYFYTDIGVNNVLDLTRYWRNHDVVAGLVQMF